jgi:hypothetical protein
MWFKKKEEIKENYDVIGTPYTMAQWQSILAPYKQAVPFARDPWTWKASTVRTIHELDSVRQVGRWLAECNPYAHGLITGLRAFVIGHGFTIKCIGLEGDNKRLIKTTERLLNEFAEENELDQWFQEKFYRDHRDGESFFQLFNADQIQLRAIEPDQIRIPFGEGTEGPWSMGIKHKDFDYQTPEAYCVQFFDNSQKIIPANEIYHSKLNVVRNVKRGISSFYPCYEFLKSTQKLLWTWQEGDKARSSIAYVVQSKADKAAIQALQQGKVTGNYQQFGFDNNEYNVDIEQHPPGRVAYIPDSMQFQNPPSGSDESEAIRFGLQAVAARFNAPSWLTSGESGDSSYASAVLPESLFLRRCDHEQHRQICWWKKLIRSVVELEIKRGNLPENTLELIDIQLIPPSPVSRNREEEMKTDMELLKSKLMSQHTFCAKYGLDFDEEQEMISKEPEIQIQQQPEQGQNPKTMSGKLNKEVGAP